MYELYTGKYIYNNSRIFNEMINIDITFIREIQKNYELIQIFKKKIKWILSALVSEYKI